MASAISSADRDPAPSSRSAAVRLASPYLPGGSFAVPLNDTRFTCATGTLCSSTTHTGSPFDSFCFWIAGSLSAAGGPGCGGFVRSGACAVSTTEATNVATTTSAFFLICHLVGPIHVPALSELALRQAQGERVEGSARGGHMGPPLRFLWFDRQLHSLVERQEFGGRRADVPDRQRAIPREIFVEPVGIARVREVRVQLIAFAAESADLFHAVVERRLDLVHRSLELGRGRRFALQLLDLFVDHLLQFRDGVARPRRRDDLERRGER